MHLAAEAKGSHIRAPGLLRYPAYHGDGRLPPILRVLFGSIRGWFVEGIFVAGYGQRSARFRVEQYSLGARSADVKAEEEGHSCSAIAKIIQTWYVVRN
jgi:hypothetical protein